MFKFREFSVLSTVLLVIYCCTTTDAVHLIAESGVLDDLGLLNDFAHNVVLDKVSFSDPNMTQTDSTFCVDAPIQCTLAITSLGLLIICSIIGNLFVIAAIYLEKSLQNVANYLIVSLACADLMVAIMVMPIAAYNEVSYGWILGPIVCDIWTSFDVLCCTASILHLVAIALDRYWAITNCNYVAKRTGKRIITMIVIIWLSSTVMAVSPHVFGLGSLKEQDSCHLTDNLTYQLVSTFFAFYLPLIFMCIIYWKIFQSAKFRIRKKAFKTHDAARVQSAKKFKKLRFFKKEKPNENSSSEPATTHKTSIPNQYNNVQIQMEESSKISNKPKNSVTSNQIQEEISTNTSTCNETVKYLPTDGDSSSENSHLQANNENSNKLIAPDKIKSVEISKFQRLINSNRVFFNLIFKVKKNGEFKEKERSYSQIDEKIIELGSSVNNINNDEPCVNDQTDQSLVIPDTTENSHLKAPLREDSHKFRSGSYNSYLEKHNNRKEIVKIRKPFVFSESNLTNKPSEIDSGATLPKQNISDKSINSSLAIPGDNSLVIATKVPLKATPEKNIVKPESLDINKINVSEKPLLKLYPDPNNNNGSISDPRKISLGNPGISRVSIGQNSGKFDINLIRKKQAKIDMRREKKAAKTLGVIMSCFIICWLPFFFMQLFFAVCKDCYLTSRLMNSPLVTILLWLGYLNSLLNPVIYTLFSPDFRNAFSKILFGKYRKKRFF